MPHIMRKSTFCAQYRSKLGFVQLADSWFLRKSSESIIRFRLSRKPILTPNSTLTEYLMATITSSIPENCENCVCGGGSALVISETFLCLRLGNTK